MKKHTVARATLTTKNNFWLTEGSDEDEDEEPVMASVTSSTILDRTEGVGLGGGGSCIVSVYLFCGHSPCLVLFPGGGNEYNVSWMLPLFYSNSRDNFVS